MQALCTSEVSATQANATRCRKPRNKFVIEKTKHCGSLKRIILCMLLKC